MHHSDCEKPLECKDAVAREVKKMLFIHTHEGYTEYYYTGERRIIDARTASCNPTMEHSPTSSTDHILQETSFSYNPVYFDTRDCAFLTLISSYPSTRHRATIDLRYDSRNVSWKSTGWGGCRNSIPGSGNAWRSRSTAKVCESWQHLHIWLYHASKFGLSQNRLSLFCKGYWAPFPLIVETWNHTTWMLASHFRALAV